MTLATEEKHLDGLVQQLLKEHDPAGGRVESQGDYQAIVVEGRRVNHILHVILSFLTCGFWLIIWIVLGIAGGEKRKLVKVDEDGNETVTRL